MGNEAMLANAADRTRTALQDRTKQVMQASGFARRQGGMASVPFNRGPEAAQFVAAGRDALGISGFDVAMSDMAQMPVGAASSGTLAEPGAFVQQAMFREWKRRKQVARDMAEAGRSPEEVAAMDPGLWKGGTGKDDTPSTTGSLKSTLAANPERAAKMQAAREARTKAKEVGALVKQSRAQGETLTPAQASVQVDLAKGKPVDMQRWVAAGFKSDDHPDARRLAVAEKGIAAATEAMAAAPDAATANTIADRVVSPLVVMTQGNATPQQPGAAPTGDLSDPAAIQAAFRQAAIQAADDPDKMAQLMAQSGVPFDQIEPMVKSLHPEWRAPSAWGRWAGAAGATAAPAVHAFSGMNPM